MFLEIDESSYRVWGEPLLTPRDKLRRLIEFSTEGGAAVVLVDIDLSRKTGPHDAALAALVREVGEDPDSAPLVLARTFREPLPGSADARREERASFLDPVVEAAPNVYWASTLFLRESDLRIRRFRNLEPTCNGERGNVIPAMQLLAASLVGRSRGRRGAPRPGARAAPARLLGNRHRRVAARHESPAR